MDTVIYVSDIHISTDGHCYLGDLKHLNKIVITNGAGLDS